MEDKVECEKRLNSNIDQLVLNYRSSRLQFIYYFLTITAACIAFSISISYKDKYSALLIPLGLSVLSWGYSFISGLNEIFNIEQINERNRLLLEAEREGKESNQHYKAVRIHQQNIPRFHRCQMISFAAGVIFFIIWLGIKMYFN